MAKQYIPDEEFNSMSAEHMQVSAQLETLKAREIELRNNLIKKVFPRGVSEGTHNVILPEGWVMKVQGKTNISVDPAAVEATKQLIEDAVKEGKVTGFTFDEVIKYKPELSKSGWNALSEDQKHLLRNCLSEKAGQASIEFTKPKRAVK